MSSKLLITLYIVMARKLLVNVAIVSAADVETYP